MKSLRVKLLPAAAAPSVPAPKEGNPDRISPTRALKRTSYARFREIINLYAATFVRSGGQASPGRGRALMQRDRQ